MKHVPLRSCIVCRAQKDKRELVRIVKQKDGTIVLDPTGKLDGRGAYVCRDSKCIDELEKRRALNRTFKVPVEAETYAAIKEELKKLCDERN